MQYQSDYILRLIEQVGGLIRRALSKVGVGAAEEPYDLLAQAVGLALDMDPKLASRLSPQSLSSLVELNNIDERVVELIAEALEIEADLLERDVEFAAAVLRRDQARAVRNHLGSGHAN